MTYNGHGLREFLPERTAVYVEQEDQHMPELTVRETFDFSARCQGIGSRAGALPALFSLQRVPCSCSCGSRTLWGRHVTSWIVLMSLVPCLMMHQPHCHQPWRLDKCNTSTHSLAQCGSAMLSCSLAVPKRSGACSALCRNQVVLQRQTGQGGV